MPRKTTSPRYARIAITLPEADLAAADRLARALDRPRSWVIAEAVRQYAAGAPEKTPGRDAVAGRGAGRGAEPANVYGSGLGPLHLDQLRRDFALTPEERVKEAEETLRLDDVLARQARKPTARYIVTFDRLEDYVDWKRHRIRLP